MESVDYFSFTTDAGTASLLSHTAHWLTYDFTIESLLFYMLYVQPLEDAHTGEYLGGVYKQMLGHTYLKSCCSDLFYNKMGRLVGKKKKKKSYIARV